MICPEEHLARLRRAIAWANAEMAHATGRAQGAIDHVNAEVSEALRIPAGTSINIETGEITIPESSPE